jgi:hypothetical protein
MKNLFNRMSGLAPALVEQVGARQIQRMCDILLVFPVIVMMTVVGLYLTLWRVDPFVRFAHMLWVLGFWMLGTLGILMPLLFMALATSAPAWGNGIKLCKMIESRVTKVIPFCNEMLDMVSSNLHYPWTCSIETSSHGNSFRSVLY